MSEKENGNSEYSLTFLSHKLREVEREEDHLGTVRIKLSCRETSCCTGGNGVELELTEEDLKRLKKGLDILAEEACPE